MILEVKVTPHASKNEILRWEDERLVVKIQGVPEKGRVNENLIALLAKTLEIAKSQIEIFSGATSRIKKLNIQGISTKEMKRILSEKMRIRNGGKCPASKPQYCADT